MRTTYVSAYYHIPKRRVPHMGIARYVRLAPETLSMISGDRLYFYYEEPFIGTLFERLAQNLDIDIIPVRRTLNELPFRDVAKVISYCSQSPSSEGTKAACKEKGTSHIRSMDVDGDRSEYLDNLTVWLSKIELVCQSARRMKDSDSSLAWIDVGLSKKNFTRENWNFTEARLLHRKVLHYASDMRYQGNPLPLNASFLKASSKEWERLSHLFFGKAQQLQEDGYPHDEETILSHVVHEHPDLFQCIGRPFSGPLRSVRYYAHRFRGRNVRE